MPEPTVAKGPPTGASFAAGGVAPVDFAALKLGDRPNRFLMCPPGLRGAEAHAESPIFEVPVDRLRARWEAVAADQPRVTQLAGGPDGAASAYAGRPALRRPSR